MSNVNILVIAPYAEIKPVIEEVASSYPQFNTDIFVGSYDEAIVQFNWLKENTLETDYDLLVARGYTAEQIALTCSLPVVEIETSLYDTLRAIKIAQQRTCSFAIVGVKAIINIAKQLITILKIQNTVTIDISSKEMALEQIRILKDSGINLIVGDLFAVDACNLLGIDSILISSGKASIENTFVHLTKLCQSIQHYHRYTEILRDALNCTNHTVLIYDEAYHMKFSNEHNEYPIPEILKQELPKYFNNLITNDTITIKKQIKRILYKLEITRSGYEPKYYIVHIHTYSPHISQIFDKCVQFVNTLEVFPGDIVFTGIGHLISTKAFPVSKTRNNRESIMIYGDKGTGKEYLARLYWKESRYCNSPLIIIDCNHLTENNWQLLTENSESIIYELNFVVLFKNIHMLSGSMQKILYDFLKNTLYRKNHIVLCTTTINLAALVANGTFLPELYSEVAEFEHYLPALHEQTKQIIDIANHCISKFNILYNAEVIALEEDAMEVLTKYHWSGNIDQLQDTMRYLIINAASSYISVEEVRVALNRFITIQDNEKHYVSLCGTINEMNLQIASIVLKECNGNSAEAARRLGISRSTLWRMLKNTKQITESEE